MTEVTQPPAEVTLPVRVDGRPVLVVGGIGTALGRVSALIRAGAVVTVLAEHVDAALEDLAERGLLTWERRGLDPSDLHGGAMVVCATGDPGQDAEVRTLAEAAGAWSVAPTHPWGTPDGNEDPGPDVSPASSHVGAVVLVGGGPGDPGLITVRGLEEVRRADVVVVDRLAPLAVLDDLPHHVEVVDVSKIPHGRSTSQEEINAVLLEHALAGRRVVRLKGGDPYVFGRGMEELLACVDAGVPVEVVPGVTSAVAAPALAGIPVTHRGLAQGFTVVSGHLAPDDPESTLDWAALARSGTTMVLLMGVHTLHPIAGALLHGGLAAGTPLACVMDAGLPSQRAVVATLGEVAEHGPPDGLSAPAVTVIGDVAGFAGNVTEWS